MKILLISIFTLLFCLARQEYSFAQDSAGLHRVASDYVSAINKKADKLDKQIDRRTLKLLEEMRSIESRLSKQLAKKDSSESKRIFGKSEEVYTQWKARLTSPVSNEGLKNNRYMAYMDTVTTSLGFLEGSSLSGIRTETIKEAQDKLGNLQSKFDETAAFQQF